MFCQVSQNSLVFSPRLGSLFGVLGVKRIDRFAQRLARPSEGLVLDLGESPGGALQIAGLERFSDAVAILHPADANGAMAATFQVIRSLLLVRALFRVPSLECKHAYHSNAHRVHSRNSHTNAEGEEARTI